MSKRMTETLIVSTLKKQKQKDAYLLKGCAVNTVSLVRLSINGDLSMVAWKRPMLNA